MYVIELLVVIGLVLLQCVLVLSDTTGVVRLSSGFLFVTLLPGYSFLAAFSRPHLEKWSVLEHVVLAVPISLALNSILGLLLNMLSLSIEAHLHVLWMSLFICLMTWWSLKEPVRNDQQRGYLTVMGGMVVATLLLAVVAQGGAKEAAPFVSLYVLDANGQAADYPNQLAKGEALEVTVGARYEGESAQAFQLLSPTGEKMALTLQPGEEWSKPMRLRLAEDGLQRVSWELYQVGATQPVRSVQLWIKVQ